MNKKICLMCYNVSYAGAQTQMLELYKKLIERNYKIRICVFNKEILLKDEFKDTLEGIDVVEKKYKYDIIWFVKLTKYLIENKYDVLYTFLQLANVVGMISGKIANINYVISSERNSNYKLNHATKMALRFVIWGCDCMISNTYAGKNFVEEFVNKKYKSKIKVVYNGRKIDSNIANDIKTQIKNDLKISIDCYVISLFARFRPSKNHKMFFRIAKRLLESKKDIIFLCVGDADKYYEEYYREIMDNFKSFNIDSHFRFLGARSDVLELMSITDVSVMTSYHEGLSNTLIESMAMGCSLVVTDISDNKIIVKESLNGFVVPVNDDFAMVDAIMRILTNPILKRSISENNKKLANECFSIERMANETENIINGSK